MSTDVKYALLQKTLEIPPIDSLKRAFRASRSLTEYDAHILAQDAYGILVRDIASDEAFVLHDALASEGIETELVTEKSLPVLPAAKLVRKLALSSEALILHDPLGRPFPLAWEHIQVLAAGNVRLQKFRKVAQSMPVSPFLRSSGIDGTDPSFGSHSVDYTTREETVTDFMLEIVITGGALRYTVNVDKPFLFQLLGTRFNQNLSENFRVVVQEICRSASHAVLNRGAYLLSRNDQQPFVYPSKTAFLEEIIWLLWHLRRAQSPESAS